EIREELFEKHLTSVRFDPGPGKRSGVERGEEREPSILFAPRLGDIRGGGRPDGKIVLALARGVLYALDQGTGRVRWAQRVGIDTASLPVRVPATASSKERILVLSSDTVTLTALDTDGEVQWRYRLSQPCLG